MCYGSQSNEKARAKNDLGRFGLGMKSASLSQCKKMTALRHDPISQNRRTFALSIYKLGGVYPEP